MTTPHLQLETCFSLDERGRICGTREPNGTAGPLFALVRGKRDVAFSVRIDVPDDVAAELVALARTEPPTDDFTREPIHGERYVHALGVDPTKPQSVQTYSGVAFVFPTPALEPTDVEPIRLRDEGPLKRHFRGWMDGEIAEGRDPTLAILREGHAVSTGFCARRGTRAAEAGVETAEGFRGRGFAPRVVSAWAFAVQTAGLVPLYSTSWDNTASLAVAGKLALIPYASNWSLNAV